MKKKESKEIILETDPKTGKMVDMKGRPVNANGYLIDSYGNIVKYFRDKKDEKKGEHTKIMFNFWEIMF